MHDIWEKSTGYPDSYVLRSVRSMKYMKELFP